MKNTMLISFKIPVIILLIIAGCSEEPLQYKGLQIGWAIEDITPEGPVMLQGQFYPRESQYVQSPLKATAIAIEYTGNQREREEAIMVSADIIGIRRDFQDSLRKLISSRIPGFDTQKLFINATHTHSSYRGALTSEHSDLLLNKLEEVVVSAWNNREPAGISSALAYEVVGHNRRVRYSDGTTQMYGLTSRDDFTGLEGPTDHGVDIIYTWDINRNLTGVIMNVSCPAQVTESKYYVSADYWSEVRNQLKEKFSDNIYVLSQIGAAGDISPRDLPRGYRGSEPNMWDVPGIIEIGRRLTRAVSDNYNSARQSIETDPVFRHLVNEIDLPVRVYSEEEYKRSLEIVNEIQSREPTDPDSPNSAWNRFLTEVKENEEVMEYGPWDDKKSDFGELRAHEGVLNRYRLQDKEPYYNMEFNAVRLGEVVFITNPFELYVEYGLRITGRSRANQTFIVQLCGDGGGYLPTREAVSGGGYSAIVTRIGPEGGDILVEKSVEMINSLWDDK